MFYEKATKIDEICQVIYKFGKKMYNLVEDFAKILWHSQKTLTLLVLARIGDELEFPRIII